MVDRLSILISGKGGIKLLGVPAVPYKCTEKTGPLVAEASMNLLREWNCADNITGMVFDTTSSNTGSQTAACVSIQSILRRPLYACRHHVGEIILSHIWEALKIETAKSPDISIFQRFKDNFQSLTYKDTAQLNIFKQPQDDIAQSQIADIVSLCKDLKKHQFRDDYKELMELTMVYIGAMDDQEIVFKFPGDRNPSAPGTLIR